MSRSPSFPSGPSGTKRSMYSALKVSGTVRCLTPICGLFFLCCPAFAQENARSYAAPSLRPAVASGQAAPSDFEKTWGAVVPEWPEVPDLEQLKRLGLVWVEDDLPYGAQAQGPWEWNARTVTSGLRAHGHPPGAGLQRHRFMAAPLLFYADGLVLQEVWLDPKDPPQGIALRFILADGSEVGVYWEGEREVFEPGQHGELWYYGVMPQFGVWTELQVLVEDLGIEDREVVGVEYVTHGGRALWDRTILKGAPEAPRKREIGA